MNKIVMGNILKQVRREKGMRQVELAALTGIKQPNISRIEDGLVTPRPGTLERILSALGIDATVFEDPRRLQEAHPQTNVYVLVEYDGAAKDALELTPIGTRVLTLHGIFMDHEWAKGRLDILAETSSTRDGLRIETWIFDANNLPKLGHTG